MRAKFENVRPVRVDGAALPTDPPSSDRVERSVVRVLEQTGLCAWATVTAAGQAHVNIGYFATSENLDFYLLSHPHSLHCRNLTTNPSMAVAVFVSPQHWTDPGRGIQFFGTSRQVSQADHHEAERVYQRRYQPYDDWQLTLKVGDPALDYRFYRFVPERLKILDEAEFGDAVFVEADIVRNVAA
jgi:uncharacterized protein YhbP (UPF0306 family)